MKTTENQGIRSIPSLVIAAPLSGAGFVTDASAQVQPHSYLIDLNTRTATDLGDVRATALNDTGQVVGQSSVTDRGFITGPNGVGMKDLGFLEPIAVIMPARWPEIIIPTRAPAALLSPALMEWV